MSLLTMKRIWGSCCKLHCKRKQALHIPCLGPCYLLLLVLCRVRWWIHIMSWSLDFTVSIITTIQKSNKLDLVLWERGGIVLIILNCRTWFRKMKCLDILKHGSSYDIVKLPSETAHNNDHNRKQGGWPIQGNCVKKVARGHSRRYDDVVAEDK